MQGLVQRRAMVPDPRVHRELLFGIAGDRDPAIPQNPERDPEREASVLGLQFGSSELGCQYSPLAGGFCDQIPISRGAEAQEDDRYG